MLGDNEKHRREFIRWLLLLGLYNSRPIGAWEEVLLSICQGIYPDTTRHEIRLGLDYLFDRQLIDLQKRPDGRWFSDLNRNGTDIVEYTVVVEPGIARPEKFG